jgi:hypothetical protein
VSASKNPKLVALDDAIVEAERFIKRAKAARATFAEIKPMKHGGSSWWRYDSVPFATAKRASMDLTRDLARLRRA